LTGSQLFEGIYDFAGKIRDYNISKKEWVLNDKSVYYDDFRTVKHLLSHTETVRYGVRSDTGVTPLYR